MEKKLDRPWGFSFLELLTLGQRGDDHSDQDNGCGPERAKAERFTQQEAAEQDGDHGIDVSIRGHPGRRADFQQPDVSAKGDPGAKYDEV